MRGYCAPPSRGRRSAPGGVLPRPVGEGGAPIAGIRCSAWSGKAERTGLSCPARSGRAGRLQRDPMLRPVGEGGAHGVAGPVSE